MPAAGGAFRSLAGNKALVRVVGGYVLFTLTEYSVWIAMLVYAYRHGGAAIAGLVAVAQLVPAAVLAPVAAAAADRRSPVFLLVGGYLVQAAGMAATAVAVMAGVPLAAYAAAVVASAAVTTARPAQSAVHPVGGGDPGSADGGQRGRELGGGRRDRGGRADDWGADRGRGRGERVRRVRGPGLAAALLVAGLRVPPLASAAGASVRGAGWPGHEASRLMGGRPRLRLMLALLTAEAIVVGCAGPAVRHPGHRRAAPLAGVGGISQRRVGRRRAAGRAASAMLVGRRLGVPILAAALHAQRRDGGPGVRSWPGRDHGLPRRGRGRPRHAERGPPLDAAAFGSAAADGPDLRRARGAHIAGYAVGALLVPPAGAPGRQPARAARESRSCCRWRPPSAGAGCSPWTPGYPVPVVEIALLRSLPLFGELPAPAIEGLAAALTPVVLPAGGVLIRQGDPGDAYYADRLRRARCPPGRAFPAPLRTRRGSGGDRPAARHPAHGQRGGATPPPPSTSWTGNLS